jgi:DNA-binding NtrC family response regulator
MELFSRVLPFPPPRVDPATEDSHALLGPSTAIARLWEQVRRVAPHFRTALLTGEPGTAAESAARALHGLSPAASQPLLVLASEEAEQQLRSRSLLDGTIYLSELDRLSSAAQSGLRHLLRQRGPQPVRVIAYSPSSLRTLVSASGFNPDLSASLGALRIALPALRERTEDIAFLAAHFLQQSAELRSVAPPALSPDLLEAARSHAWPGNLDQLRAALDWLIVERGGQSAFDATDLETALAAAAAAKPPEPAPARLIRLDKVVNDHVRSVLAACHGNKLRAAEILGISRSTLYRMLDQTATDQAGNHASMPIAV